MAHLYASFADASLAEKAAGALLDHGVRNEDITVVANDTYGNTRQTAGTNFSNAASNTGNAVAGAGDRLAGSVTGALGAHAASAGYENASAQRAAGGTVTTDYGTTTTGDRTFNDEMDTDDGSVNTVDNAAKHGISTTTPEDAGEGAVKGTGVGLAVGAIAALASLIVPGVGLVLGGGALATALGGAALAAGAGAVAGGVTGYLKDQGVPADVAEHYHGTVQGGGAVLSINTPSGNVDQTEIQSVLTKYGGSNVNSY